MQVSGKSMKSTCPYTHESGVHGKFTSSKNLSDQVKYPNNLISYMVAQSLKTKKRSICKKKGDSDSDAESDHFNFRNIYIGKDSDSERYHGFKERLNMAKLWS